MPESTLLRLLIALVNHLPFCFRLDYTFRLSERRLHQPGHLDKEALDCAYCCWDLLISQLLLILLDYHRSCPSSSAMEVLQSYLILFHLALVNSAFAFENSN